ncbi:MAG: PhoPQ-activated protein PqaA family protein, partial [Balneolaceae bacterium]
MNQFRILILIIPVLFFSFCTSETETTHPFEAYLSKVDNVYEYELQHTIEGDEYTAYVVKMVSQQWLTEEIVDQPVWWHWLTIV